MPTDKLGPGSMARNAGSDSSRNPAHLDTIGSGTLALIDFKSSNDTVTVSVRMRAVQEVSSCVVGLWPHAR